MSATAANTRRVSLPAVLVRSDYPSCSTMTEMPASSMARRVCSTSIESRQTIQLSYDQRVPRLQPLAEPGELGALHRGNFPANGVREPAPAGHVVASLGQIEALIL